MYHPVHLASHVFGELPGGEDVVEFTLTNVNGVTLKFITYGGIITELHVPDRRGVSADVVLGFNRLADYLEGHSYFGAIIGRVAGRITGGRFSLDAHDYQLPVNDPPNHTHGGGVGFDNRLWSPQIVTTAAGFPGVKLTYFSLHGEEGYPGNLDVAVTYSLTNDNAVVIDYEAVSDRATLVNLTNHSYFNLAGKGSGSVENHVLQIFAAEITPTDEQMTLLGTRSAVAGKANDFNQPKRLGDAIPLLLNQHGDNYLLSRAARPTPLCVARLEDPASGRVMEVLTTATCLQLYTGVGLDNSRVGKSDRAYPRFGGLALECQDYPDGANHPELGDIVLRSGKIYRQTTIYRFQTA